MLITEEYRRLNAEKLRTDSTYGTIAGHNETAALIHQICIQYHFTSVLDYGCGQGYLRLALPEPRHYGVNEYDPCVPGKDNPPDPAELVYCGDVLEHVEPECLNHVLDDIKLLALKYVILSVATVLAKKHLPDGRNTHLIVEPAHWWFPKIAARWHIVQFAGNTKAFQCMCLPLNAVVKQQIVTA